MDGKLWRSVGIDGESVSYSGVDARAAAIMDRMLDGLSFVPKANAR